MGGFSSGKARIELTEPHGAVTLRHERIDRANLGQDDEIGMSLVADELNIRSKQGKPAINRGQVRRSETIQYKLIGLPEIRFGDHARLKRGAQRLGHHGVPTDFLD